MYRMYEDGRNREMWDAGSESDRDYILLNRLRCIDDIPRNILEGFNSATANHSLYHARARAIERAAHRPPVQCRGFHHPSAFSKSDCPSPPISNRFSLVLHLWTYLSPSQLSQTCNCLALTVHPTDLSSSHFNCSSSVAICTAAVWRSLCTATRC